MFHLRLVKALSYTGVVSATKKEPDVFTEDKAIAEMAVASGYFKLVEDEPQPEQETVKGHLDKGQLETMKFEELKELATKMGVEIKGISKKVDLIEAIAAVEVEAGPEADENEVDYSEDAGSPTMVELQKE